MLTKFSTRKGRRAEARHDNAGRCGARRRGESKSGRTVVAVSLVEDGFAMASAAEMRLKLLFRLNVYVADIAVLYSVNFSREPRFVQTARYVLAIHDGRAALDLADAAAFPAARNRRARTTVMVLAEKAVANGNCTPADFARRKTRDPVLGWDRGGNRHASDSCGAASADGSRGAEDFANRYTPILGLGGGDTPILGLGGGGNTHANVSCGAASAAGSRGAEDLANRYTRNPVCSDNSAADFRSAEDGTGGGV
jgi:hypothetical protein